MEKKSFRSTATQFISEETRQKIDQVQEPSKTAQPDFIVPKGYKLAQETKSVRLQLLIQPTTKAALKELAAAKSISVNELINKILKEYISKEGSY